MRLLNLVRTIDMDLGVTDIKIYGKIGDCLGTEWVLFIFLTYSSHSAKIFSKYFNSKKI